MESLKKGLVALLTGAVLVGSSLVGRAENEVLEIRNSVGGVVSAPTKITFGQGTSGYDFGLDQPATIAPLGNPGAFSMQGVYQSSPSFVPNNGSVVIGLTYNGQLDEEMSNSFSFSFPNYKSNAFRNVVVQEMSKNFSPVGLPQRMDVPSKGKMYLSNFPAGTHGGLSPKKYLLITPGEEIAQTGLCNIRNSTNGNCFEVYNFSPNKTADVERATSLTEGDWNFFETINPTNTPLVDVVDSDSRTNDLSFGAYRIKYKE